MSLRKRALRPVFDQDLSPLEEDLNLLMGDEPQYPRKYSRPGPIVEGQWEVERLVGKREEGGCIEYEVQWLGYPTTDNMWLREEDIDPDIVIAYERTLAEQSEKIEDVEQESASLAS